MINRETQLILFSSRKYIFHVPFNYMYIFVILMKKVLVVDDNEDLRLLLRLMLDDYDVIEAKDGLEAVEFYTRDKLDLVLMDILMPKKDGIEATREIKELHPDANIIAITAYSSHSDKILDAGAKKVVQKPIRKHDLILLVEENI